MADIELVIKIPEEIRLALINNIQLSLDQQSICDSYIKQAIINGTPLPELYKEKGCDYFEAHMSDIQAICDAIKDLSERVDNIEKQMKEEKEEEIKKLKAELEYAKFHSALPTIMNMMSDNRK